MLRTLEKPYVWVFADGCKQRSPLSLAALLTEEYNMLKQMSRGGGAEAQGNDARELSVLFSLSFPEFS
jgi:hypothetical protein